jgi:hypothetical protein
MILRVHIINKAMNQTAIFHDCTLLHKYMSTVASKSQTIELTSGVPENTIAIARVKSDIAIADIV